MDYFFWYSWEPKGMDRTILSLHLQRPEEVKELAWVRPVCAYCLRFRSHWAYLYGQLHCTGTGIGIDLCTPPAWAWSLCEVLTCANVLARGHSPRVSFDLPCFVSYVHTPLWVPRYVYCTTSPLSWLSSYFMFMMLDRQDSQTSLLEGP